MIEVTKNSRLSRRARSGLRVDDIYFGHFSSACLLPIWTVYFSRSAEVKVIMLVKSRSFEGVIRAVC